jgi:hypothetical protein
VDSRSKRPDSVDDTRRVPVLDFSPTRIFGQAQESHQVRQGRQARTPVWSPAVVAFEPGPRSGPLAHPRLVRRLRAPAPTPTAPSRRVSTRDREFEDEPTGRCGG